jgi:phosphatidylglycerol:prolipoprotein diacylglycerol transferase
VNYQAEFKGRWFAIINPWQGGTFGIGGMNLVGGLILSTILGMAFLRWKKQPVLLGVDLVMPALALGIGLTRLGCFLNGCCWGLPTTLPWGVTFPAESVTGAYQELTQCGPVHPTQIYSSLAAFFIFGLLLYLERFKKFNGFTFCVFGIAYGTKRFLIDFLRHYPPHEVHAGLTNNQYIWLGLIVFFGTLFYRLRRNNLRQSPHLRQPSPV